VGQKGGQRPGAEKNDGVPASKVGGELSKGSTARSLGGVTIKGKACPLGGGGRSARMKQSRRLLSGKDRGGGARRKMGVSGFYSRSSAGKILPTWLPM